jgi:GTP 3',8-cyclase
VSAVSKWEYAKWFCYKIGQKARNWRQYNDPLFPTLIAIETSRFCNHRCHYCPVSTIGSVKELMTWSTFDCIVRELQKMRWSGVVCWNYLSEPLLDDRLLAMIKTLKDSCPKSKPIVYTNADALTESLVRDLIDAGMHRMIITRHPPFRAKWDNAVSQIARQFPKKIRIQPSLEGEQWLHNYAGEVNRHLPPRKRCDAVYESLTILCSGDVLMCCQCAHRKPTMGNIQDISLLGIWNSSAFVRVRADAKRREPTLPICKACLGL